MVKRSLCMLLAVLMALSMAFPAYAEEGPQEPAVTEQSTPPADLFGA